MRSRGFSLLEAMVTLVIVAMIMALLMQSLVYVLGLRERLLRHEADARTAALHEQWFRESVASALGDAPDGAQPFAGSAEGFRMLGADALRSGAGAVLAWRIVDAAGRRHLEYVEEGEAVVVLADGLEEGRFEYRDLAGRWHEAWPVEGLPDEHLPRAVRLNARRGDAPWDWWVAIPASPSLQPSLTLNFDAQSASP